MPGDEQRSAASVQPPGGGGRASSPRAARAGHGERDGHAAPAPEAGGDPAFGARGTPGTPDAPAAGEARFRALVEHACDLIAVLDEDGRTRYASPSHLRVLGLAPAVLEGADWTALAHPDDAGILRRSLAEARHAGAAVRPRPVRVRHQDDGWRTIDLLLTDLRDEPAVAGIVVTGRDVSEQEELAEQLRQAEKMEALAQLAGGMAHDFNNVLAAIAGFAQLVRADLAADDARRADLDEIVAATARGSAVTRQLLTFSHRRAGELRAVDLADVAREAADALRALLPPTIALEVRADGPLWVRADRAQLELLLTNLARNARDAMPAGGTLEIAVEPRGGAHGAAALLRVRDTGVGMRPEVRSRVFEPFFTTKPIGQGSGLGLATVYGIVRQTGGTVSVESAPGAGTTFTVRLPAAEPPAPPAAPDPARPPRVGTIVLVEDDAPVRLSVQRLLERDGHTVVAAEDGAAALRLLLERDGRADLLLSDATMPVLGGRELATRVAARWPRLPVVLMSGNSEWSGTRAATPGLPNVVALLDKPFTAERLRELVTRVLGG